MRRRSATSGGRSRTSSIRTRRKGGGVPDLRLWPIGGPFCIGRQEVVPVPLRHGPWDVLGFRFGPVRIPDRLQRRARDSLALLEGSTCSCSTRCGTSRIPPISRSTRPSSMARRIGARQTYFTHIAHDLGHEATCAALPRRHGARVRWALVASRRRLMAGRLFPDAPRPAGAPGRGARQLRRPAPRPPETLDECAGRRASAAARRSR